MSDKLKICFVCPKAYPLFAPDTAGVFGGAEVDLYILSRSLAADGVFDISFVVGDYGQSDGEIREGIKFYKSIRPGEKSVFSPLKIWKAMKRSCADVYMLETMSPGLILLWLYCAFNSAKYVFRTAHSDHCDGTFLSRHRLSSFLYRIAVKKAAALIAQNDSDAVGIRKTYNLPAVVIPNAHVFDGKAKSSGDYALWAARSASFKNPYMFIRLAKSLPSRRFVMLCPAAFGDTQYHKLRQAAEEADNLEFVEGVSFSQTEHYFAKASVFVNTSDSEGFPNTFIQAAKAAVPIASYKVNPDNFLDAYNCGRCAGGSFDKLVEIVSELLTDKSLNKRLGENGFIYAAAKHDIVKIAPVYAEIFRKAANYGR